MAAHDDKVSVNRRRLFKALSAAPVVVTLSPGSALAQSSAYQCLLNDPQIAEFRETGVECGTTDSNCFAYAELFYWEIQDDLDPCGLGLSNGNWLVEIDATNKIYATYPDGDVVDVTVELDTSAPVPDTWIVSTGAGNCYSGLERKTGNFLLTAPLTPDGTQPTGYDLTQVKPSFVQPISADVRGISQTCLMSVNPSASFTDPNRFLGG